MTRSFRAFVVALLAFAVVLTGCTSTVSTEPAVDANDPLCAEMMVRLPSTVDNLDRRWTDSQATAAWGDPTAVILTCGLEEPGPSTLPCQSPGGVDWLIDDSEAPYYRFTTFGRSPAVQVYLNYDEVSGNDVLQALASAVFQIPQKGGECTDRPSTDS
ncbi:hypothetical protein FHX49_000193 [Microbacterium endophyticum]|uniref:DUF3515 domain-containing protein n=1 Tax=Microbacterium endophyticum TaxID=1526412 RepID=A0A7W4V0N3_9MICO|nr:DUF3515 domain-containing protein [Microbacterium endophyticum]MBB2974652.1 hypothetical protein [Microbacterium endophyticum]NIK36949.1 hypothetical protein [Microbacterium endophyticum]